MTFTPSYFATHLSRTQPESMRRLKQLFSRKTPTPPIIPENEGAKEYALFEAQWNDTLQQSLRDFEIKYEQEETVRSAGEQTRWDEFDLTMTIFRVIFLRNQIRRQYLYDKTDALQEERCQKADAVREALFVQGQHDRAHAFEIDQEMRGKRAEWYSTARKVLSSDGHQRLIEKCDALNADLVEQFDRLMERQEKMAEVAGEWSSHRDMFIPASPGRGSGPLYWRSLTSSPPLTKRPSWTSPSPCVEGLKDSSITIPFQTFSPSFPESFNSSIQPTSTQSNNQQEQSLDFAEQGDPEERTRPDYVKENRLYSSFVQSQIRWQEEFLKNERERKYQFHTSEAARDTGQSERSIVFNRQMEQWSKKSDTSQTEYFRSREEERFRRNTLRSDSFDAAEGQRWHIFSMSLSHMEVQAKAEADLEEVTFERQKDILLSLYDCQAIRLRQRITGAQSAWFESMRGRFSSKSPDVVSSGISWKSYACSQAEFAPPVIFRGRGPLIQDTLPIPEVQHSVECSTHQRKDLRKMQRSFEKSQVVRAEAFQKGENERKYHFTINEAKRKAEFVKMQQKHKEIFDQAEELLESKFEKAQQQREYEFLANEQKREDDFQKNEAERNDQARRAQKDREHHFQLTMLALQQKCIDDEKRRLEELRRLGEWLIGSREQELLRSLGKFSGSLVPPWPQPG